MATSSSSSNGTPSLPPPFWPAGIDPLFLVPILLANALSYILLGALIVQVSYYLRRYKKDSPRTRAVIWAIFFANVFHVAVQISRDVDVLGFGFGDWRRLGDLHSKPQNIMLPAISVLLISASQTVIASRSYLFCRSLAAGRPSLRERVWCGFIATLILASLACGIGAVITTASYSDLFARGKDDDFHLVGTNLYPLLEMLWLLFGTAADISIAWSMWRDARKAKTGCQTSSDSVLEVIVNVALRCGAVLAFFQTLLSILYFADTPTWSEAAHSLLPRVSSLTVIYSITSPREAYRVFLRRQDRLAAAGPSSSPCRAGGRVDSFEMAEDSFTSSGDGLNSNGTRSGCSRLRSLRRAVGLGSGKKGASGSGGGVRISFLGVGERKKRSREAVGEEGVQGWLEKGGKRGFGGKVVEEEGMMRLNEKGSRGSGGGEGSTSSAVVVQTTSVVSVERVSEEGKERLGNTVIIEGLNAPSPPLPLRSRSQQNHHLLRLSSTSNLRRERSSRQNPNQTNSDPHPLRSSHSHSYNDPSPSPPNFMDSFPSRPTVTSSIGTYNEAMVDEMFNLETL